MFRLTGTDLPASRQGTACVAPAFRVWQGSARGMGVLARINTYANYSIPGFDIRQLDIPRPIATGFLFKLLPPFAFKTPHLEGFQLLPEAINPLPKMFWVGDDVINIYAPQQFAPPSLTITLLASVPIPGQAIAIVSGFTVTSVSYQGLSIPFTQMGLALTLQSEYAVAVGDELEVVGTYVTDAQFVCYVASFLFSDLDYVDRFDYMGTNFTPARDATNPQVGEFVWSETLKLCTVFSAMPMEAPALNWDYLSSTGSLSY